MRGARRQARRRVGNWPVVCAGQAMTLALVLTLAVLLVRQRQPLVAWLIGVSATAFVYYGYDKLAAQRDRLRVPESVLLGLALLGGSPGALLAMLAFRHKIRKGSFLLAFFAVLLVQLVAVAAWRRFLA